MADGQGQFVDHGEQHRPDELVDDAYGIVHVLHPGARAVSRDDDVDDQSKYLHRVDEEHAQVLENGRDVDTSATRSSLWQ